MEIKSFENLQVWQQPRFKIIDFNSYIVSKCAILIRNMF